MLYTKDSKTKLFKLKQSYLFYDNGERHYQAFDFPDNAPKPVGNDILTERNAINVPIQQDRPFKIIFEIEVIKSTKANGQEFRIRFQKLSLGEPCYNYGQARSKCNEGACFGTGPEQYTCKCPSNFAGKRCELKNRCKDKVSLVHILVP